MTDASFSDGDAPCAAFPEVSWKENLRAKVSLSSRVLGKSWRLLYILGVPLLLLPVALHIEGKAGWCAYILLWMAFYWSAEAIPLAATALMPVFLFPFFGILNSQKVAAFYLNEIGMVMLCSLIMAGAVETSNLHKRIALKSLLAIGTSNLRLLLGFMLVTMALSVWIPNTASTSIMAPIVIAVVDLVHTTSSSVEDDEESNASECLNKAKDCDPVPQRKLSSSQLTRQKALLTTMLLSVAYAANIGSTGSPIGTGPNLVLKDLIDEMFPSSTEVSFGSWMLYNIPTMILCVIVAWAYLLLSSIRTMRSSSHCTAQEKVREEIARRYNELGPLSFPEVCVMFLMVVMILLWVTMEPLLLPGWVDLLPFGNAIKASAPAMLVTLLLFCIPRDPRRPWKSGPIITWREASDRAQWGVMILIGGGMCLAEGCKQSGLSALLVQHLKSLDVLPHALTVFVLCFATSMFTEVISNPAVSSILLPVVIEMAIEMRVHPLYLAMPVAISASFSFMLPCATPPNAIVYELAKLTIPEMAKPGFVMNMVCVLVEVGMIHAIGFPIFGLGKFPAWARPPEDSCSLTVVPNTTDLTPLPTELTTSNCTQVA
ncbi:solute carrier family 13 member 5-like isoform X2 [Dermacentor silvarum]|uniref:solute carrier family 13 member 5-like isoform X2 n=1 Tax=Dermacentor silvarum TaxID=543639 RepID=UPI002100A0EA|nr:solute carrier family 13 member 5-like isoform X2 [Dermacentor silvarum]